MSKKDNSNSPRYYLRNSDGKKSLSATVVLISFCSIMLLYVLSAFKTLGPIELRDFNVEAAGLILSATLANYWGRRHTESKIEVARKNKPDNQLPQNREEEGGD